MREREREKERERKQIRKIIAVLNVKLINN